MGGVQHSHLCVHAAINPIKLGQHVRTHMRTNTQSSTYVHTRIYSLCVYTRTYLLQLHTHTHTHVQIHTHTHSSMCTNTDTHAHAQAHLSQGEVALIGQGGVHELGRVALVLPCVLQIRIRGNDVPPVRSKKDHVKPTFIEQLANRY
jgi:hypothetical protein